MPSETSPGFSRRLAYHFLPVLGLVLVLWAVELVNLAMGHRLNVHGLMPRTASGVAGILWSPFLHGNFGHLLSNTVPILVLGALVCSRGPRVFAAVSVVVIVAGGLGLWIVGRSAYHVGASGLIFGYFGYLVAHAWFARTVGAAIVAVITVLLYSGLIWGVFPQGRFVSWEGHLCGLLAGVLAARLILDRR